MLERRRHRRQRVCLEGVVASGLVTPILRVRLRNLSANGVEIVVPRGHIGSQQVDFCSSRCGGVPRQAKIVWRQLNRYGLEFLHAYPTDDENADTGLDALEASVAAWNEHSPGNNFG